MTCCVPQGSVFWDRLCCDRTIGDGFKLKEGQFRLGRRKKYIYDKIGEALEQVVDAPSLETFKLRVDRALSNLIEM